MFIKQNKSLFIFNLSIDLPFVPDKNNSAANSGSESLCRPRISGTEFRWLPSYVNSFLPDEGRFRVPLFVFVFYRFRYDFGLNKFPTGSPAGNLQNRLLAALISYNRACFFFLVGFVDQAGVGFTQFVHLIEKDTEHI
jgi:hypothetical protein